MIFLCLLQWSTGVLPLGAGAILNQFVQQSQPLPREDLRSSLKRRSDPPNISPPKQMRVGQPPPHPMNNQQAMAVSVPVERERERERETLCWKFGLMFFVKLPSHEFFLYSFGTVACLLYFSSYTDLKLPQKVNYIPNLVRVDVILKQSYYCTIVLLSYINVTWALVWWYRGRSWTMPWTVSVEAPPRRLPSPRGCPCHPPTPTLTSPPSRL